MITLSILVAVYNQKNYLRACINSILQQKDVDYELILVDDGSTDGSGELCDQFAALNNRIKVLHKENGGLISARNAGIAIAQGEFISFVDSDDWIDDDYYLDFIYKMKCIPDIDICVAGMIRSFPDGSQKMLSKECDGICITNYEAIEHMVDPDGLFGWWLCGKIYRRKLFDNCEMDRAYFGAEDLERNWRLFRNARCVWYSSNRKYYYRMNEFSLSQGDRILDNYSGVVGVFSRILDSDFEFPKQLELLLSIRLMQSLEILLHEIFLFNSDYIDDVFLLYQDRMRKCFLYLQIHKIQYDSFFLKEYQYCVSIYKKVIEEYVDSLERNCYIYKKIYIYGTGLLAKFITRIFERRHLKYTGYVISDGQPNYLHFRGHHVCFLSKVISDNDMNYFVLATRKIHENDIIELLLEKGHKNFLKIPSVFINL